MQDENISKAIVIVQTGMTPSAKQVYFIHRHIISLLLFKIFWFFDIKQFLIKWYAKYLPFYERIFAY